MKKPELTLCHVQRFGESRLWGPVHYKAIILCIIDIDCRLRISLSYHIASIRLGIAALLALHLTSSPAPIEYASYDRQ